MCNKQVTQIRDLGILLRDLEPFVKRPDFLRVGREFQNFRLRPREVLANWLFCVVRNYVYDTCNFTFAEAPIDGDGIIVNRETGEWIATEHVFVPPPRGEANELVEDKIVQAVEHKARRGEAYARGKSLIVFSEAVGSWFPNRVGRRINGAHHLNVVYAAGLERSDQTEFIYWLTEFAPEHSPAWRITIPFDFTFWEVDPIQ